MSLRQYQIHTEPVTTQAEAVTESRWHQPWSTPQKLAKQGLGAHYQQFLTFPPFPVVSFSWYEELSKPKKLDKIGLSAALQQVLAYQANPTTVTPFAWYANLSDPVRIKPALRAALQRFFTDDTAVIPLHTGGLMPWFAPYSEPVRFKPGLAARLQQFIAAPSQLRPTPSITAILNALETKDVFVGALRAWQRVVSGEVGVMEFSRPTAEIGVAPQTSPPGGVGLVKEITPAATGVAAAPAFSASISIRIV